MPEPLKAAIYCRVSERAGSKRRDEWDSIPRQRVALLEMAQRHGMIVAAVYEEAMSGAKERPQFDAMMAQVRAGDVDAILVATFDRLTRTEKIGEFEVMKAELRALGCKLFTVDMGHIPLDGKADSELFTDMRASVSKFERLKIRERTLAAREASAKAGKWTGHAAPYGYRTVFDPGSGARSFEIDEVQAAVVRHIFEMYLAHEGPKDIALWLQAQGYKPPRSETWNKQAIRYILKNPIYAGVSVFRKPYNRPKDTKSGPMITAASLAFPPIVSLDLFDRARAENARRQVARRNGPGLPHPLSGILRCNTCHGKMGFYAMTTGRYRCQANDSYPNRCPQPMGYNAHQAETVVLRFLKREMPRYLDRQHLAQVQAEENSEPLPDDVTPLRLRLVEAERAREAIVRKVAMEDLTKEDADFALRSLRREIDELRTQIEAAERTRKAEPTLRFAEIEELVDALEGYSPDDGQEELRELFEAMLLKVYLFRNGRDPSDRRRWRLDVSLAMLTTGDEIRRG